MWSDASDQGMFHLILELSIVLVVILRCGKATAINSQTKRVTIANSQPLEA